MIEHIGRDAFMDDLIGRMRTTMVNHDPELVVARNRDGYHYTKPDLGLVEWMPTMEVGRNVVVKMVGYHPTNPTQRNLPSVLATTSMWDTSTGHLVAICEATVLTALRTGAASALATEVLAPTGPATVGVIGCGAQAVTQVHALSRVRPVERVIAHDAEDEVAATLARRLAFLDIEVETVAHRDLGRLVSESNVLCTCTSVDIGAGPVFPDGVVRDDLHINAVGADFPGKTEIPRDLLERSFVVPDTRSQCIAEGECQQLEPDHIGPELYEVVRDAEEHQRRRSSLTVFDSTGWSVEDQVAIELVLHHGERLGLGTDIEIEGVPPDPYDPYSVLSS